MTKEISVGAERPVSGPVLTRAEVEGSRRLASLLRLQAERGQSKEVLASYVDALTKQLFVLCEDWLLAHDALNTGGSAATKNGSDV